jgi:DNA-binding transcriptional MerR regulator
MDKSFEAYKTIGEVAEILSLSSKQKKSITTHTIRFWEKKFRQIRPKILDGNRRYYNTESIELLKKIHFLLKEKGMTIDGVKKILNNKETLELDEISNQSIRTVNFKNKLIKISNILKNLKKFK